MVPTDAAAEMPSKLMSTVDRVAACRSSPATATVTAVPAATALARYLADRTIVSPERTVISAVMSCPWLATSGDATVNVTPRSAPAGTEQLAVVPGATMRAPSLGSGALPGGLSSDGSKTKYLTPIRSRIGDRPTVAGVM